GRPARDDGADTDMAAGHRAVGRGVQEQVRVGAQDQLHVPGLLPRLGHDLDLERVAGTLVGGGDGHGAAGHLKQPATVAELRVGEVGDGHRPVDEREPHRLEDDPPVVAGGDRIALNAVRRVHRHHPVRVQYAFLILPVVDESGPVDDLDLAAAHRPPEHTVGAALYANHPVRTVRYQHADPPRVVVEAEADGHANTPAPARTRLRVNALSKEISDRTTRTTSP